MSNELDETYERTWRRVVQAISVWNESLIIYGDLDNLELANETAPTFFRCAQDALWQEVNLEIARLTDKLEVAGKRTDGFRNLLELAKLKLSKDESSNLEKKLNDALKACEPIRNRRNKFLAHSDIEEVEEEFIPATKKENTEQALKAIVKFMNALEDSLGKRPIMYFEIGMSPWGSNSLMIALRKAQASGLELHQFVRTVSDGKVKWVKNTDR